jgi:hypothetical protein
MYIGQQYRLYLNGGWNASENHDLIPKEFVTDINNVNLHNGGKQPRGGCEIVNSTAITGTPNITGIYQFLRESADLNGYYVVDEFGDNIGDENGNLLVSEAGVISLIGTGAGEIISDYTDVLKTGLTIDTYFNFVTFYDKVIITNGEDKPQLWGDGLSYTWDMGSPIACTALAVAGAGVTAGTHSYKITFVTASGESSGGAKSNVVTTDGVNGQVDLSGIEIGPTGTTQRKVYRTIAGDTGNHLLVATIADNTTTTYSDTTADGSLGAASPTTSLAFLPTDWHDDWPKYMIKHGKSGNNCLVAWGVKAYPNRLYFSENGLADFSNSNVVAMNILTDKIIAVSEFAGKLIAFSQDKAFIIDDSNTDVANWNYYAAAWEGGCANQNLLVNLPNDIAVMSEEGNIYSVKATFQTGDFEVGSITKPAFIDEWIKQNVDLSQIQKFHAIYDDDLRAIKFFMILNGESLPTICLVYFVDFNLWSKHTFNIKHLCSGFFKVNNSVWKVLTGGDIGVIHSLEYEVFEDAGAEYESSFKTVPLNMGNPRTQKIVDNLWIVLIPKGTEEIGIKYFIDDVEINELFITTVNEKDMSANVLLPIGNVGNRFEFNFTNYNNSDYFISQFIIDYQDLGTGQEAVYPIGIPAIYMFGGVYPVNARNEAYYIIYDLWISKADLIAPIRQQLGSMTILNKAYAVGGYNAVAYELSNTDEFSSDVWSNKADMPSRKWGLRGSTVSDKGYVFGGYLGTSRVLDTDEYDSNIWSSKTDMPAPARVESGVTTILDKAYVFGGDDGVGSAVMDDTDEYAPDVWTAKTSLPSPERKRLPAHTIKDKGYIFGGQAASSVELQDTDEYDSDVWTAKSDMLYPPRYGHVASGNLHKGYIIGGYDGSNWTQDTDEYDHDTWRARNDIPGTGRGSAGDALLQ